MAIRVERLSKSYRAVRAVDDISFSVGAGEVFAFLGSNGAGKSTTIACLTTLKPFDSGSVVVAGHDVRSESRRARQAIVERLGAMTSDVPDRFRPETTEPGEAAGIELDVPTYAQNVHAGRYPEYGGGGELGGGDVDA